MLLSYASSVHATGGRLLATGGVTQLEGAAGGGLNPWALIGGYGTRDEIGGSAFYTYLDTGHFTLQSVGVAAGFYDRIELSYAHQWFDLGETVPGETIEMSTIGVKAKLFGDAVFAGSMASGFLSADLLHRKIREEILSLSPDTLLCPGHGPVTTVAEERAHNPFF